MVNTTKAFRSSILHFLDDPSTVNDIQTSYQFFEDGLLIVNNGRVIALGDYATLYKNPSYKLSQANIEYFPNSLIMPGFIDSHIHYPQTDIIASYGEQLLAWLENYTFPEEQKFSDYQHALDVSEFFIKQLLSAGTTTAMVFGTVHKASVDAFFNVAQSHHLRMICGKVLMDQHCPDELKDTEESGIADSQALIEKWHNVDRLSYAITPRFVPTSSAEQLRKAGELLQQYPDVYMQTHLSENKEEVAFVKSLHPNSEHYLSVYEQNGLLSKRSIFAHGIHLCDDEFKLLSKTGSSISFCPTSNLFLGSGCFDLKKSEQQGVNVSLATDIGAGTSFSMLQTMNEAYKTQQLRGDSLHPLKAFYLATLGGARSLDLADKIGNFAVGKEADFIVLNMEQTPLMKRRSQRCNTLIERLFVLAMLGDERSVIATYILGNKVKFN